MRSLLIGFLMAVALAGYGDNSNTVPASYFDYSGCDDILSGGVRMIPIQTAKGAFNVWTCRVGNNPTIKADHVKAV